VLRVIVGSLAMVVLLAAVFPFSADLVLNRFLKPKLEQAFSAHLPGSSLQLGALHYDFWADHLGCDSVVLNRKGGAPASAGSVALTGVHWGRLLVGKPTPAQIFSSARLEVTDLSAVLPTKEYRIQCGHLSVSVPDSAVTAQALALQLAISDEAFFAAAPFRRVRYRVGVASGALRGVNFAELLNGQAYRAQSLELTGAVVDSLSDREKPRRPVTNVPLPQEMLAAITKPFRLDRLTITDGQITYAARRHEGSEPGVLTFNGVQINAKEIANAAAGGQAIDLTGEGRLMDAGTLTVQMRLPVAPGTLAFHYAGKLSAMELTRFDEFMEGAGRVRIRSGSVSEAWFDIDVMGGHAHGTVRGMYRDLHVKVVNGDSGSEKGAVNRVATVLVNAVKVRNENAPDKAGVLKAGKVDYARKPEDSFLQFAWYAIRAGILDLVSLEARPIP